MQRMLEARNGKVFAYWGRRSLPMSPELDRMCYAYSPCPAFVILHWNIFALYISDFNSNITRKLRYSFFSSSFPALWTHVLTDLFYNRATTSTRFCNNLEQMSDLFTISSNVCSTSYIYYEFALLEWRGEKPYQPLRLKPMKRLRSRSLGGKSLSQLLKAFSYLQYHLSQELEFQQQRKSYRFNYVHRASLSGIKMIMIAV